MTQKILEEAKQRLQEVEDGITTMQARYRECITKKEELELKCEQCEQRLGRADKVCTRLRGEPVGVVCPKQGLEGSAWWQGLGVAGCNSSPAAHPMGLPLQLINGLSDEKVRWQETVENLEHMLHNISGDVLVAAGFVAYLGPFTVKSPQP